MERVCKPDPRSKPSKSELNALEQHFAVSSAAVALGFA